jgi:insulin-like growth factor-binding protein complex acid labile subunit
MSNLEVLDLRNNEINLLDNGVFSGLFNLKSISLGRNELQYLHPDSFLGLTNLQSVDLYGNPGLQIPTDHNFIKSHSLKNLFISQCGVRSLSVETFANVSALESLYLSGNEMNSIDTNILKALPKLPEIYLYYNPLHCDCKLYEVWRLCKERNIQTVYGSFVPKCETPSEIKGMDWGVLDNGQCLEDNITYNG